MKIYFKVGFIFSVIYLVISSIVYSELLMGIDILSRLFSIPYMYLNFPLLGIVSNVLPKEYCQPGYWGFCNSFFSVVCIAILGLILYFIVGFVVGLIIYMFGKIFDKLGWKD